MLLKPYPVEFGDGGNTAAEAPERLHVIRREQKRQVPAATTLEDLDEAALNARRLRDARSLDGLESRLDAALRLGDLR